MNNCFAAVAVGLALVAMQATPIAQSTIPKEANATMHASGPFEVKVTSQDDKSGDAPFARMALDKHYHGELEATAVGLMLSAGAPQKGAAGYVAMEKVTGTLHGKTGSFVLQHNGIMKPGALQLSVTVVPESGTGQLEGIAGTMSIKVAPDGKHTYELDYTLPTQSQSIDGK